MAEAKKGADEKSVALEESDQMKKKLQREMEALQNQIEELQAQNSKLDKSRKKLQDEVSPSLPLSRLKQSVIDEWKNAQKVVIKFPYGTQLFSPKRKELAKLPFCSVIFQAMLHEKAKEIRSTNVTELFSGSTNTPYSSGGGWRRRTET